MLIKNNPWNKTEIAGVIISPTRELAQQTSDVLSMFLRHNSLKQFNQKLLIGGTNVEEDVDWIEKNGANILICTPGRLLDLLERKDDLKLAGRMKSLVSLNIFFIYLRATNRFLFILGTFSFG